MDYNSIEYDRYLNGLLPWEPVVRANRETFEFKFTPDPGDMCDCCGCILDRKPLMVSNNRGRHYCSWFCLMIMAPRYPDQFTIVNEGCGPWNCFQVGAGTLPATIGQLTYN